MVHDDAMVVLHECMSRGHINVGARDSGRTRH